jgi:hypothetical protein
MWESTAESWSRVASRTDTARYATGPALKPPLTEMGKSDNPEEPPAPDVQQDDQVWSSLGALVMGVRLAPDMLETWWECVLAVVAITLVVCTLVDIVWHGL